MSNSSVELMACSTFNFEIYSIHKLLFRMVNIQLIASLAKEVPQVKYIHWRKVGQVGNSARPLGLIVSPHTPSLQA